MGAAEVTAVAAVPMAVQAAGATMAVAVAHITVALGNRVVAPMRAAVKAAADLMAEVVTAEAERAMAEAADRKRGAA
jgi:hypothetical protein